MMEERRAHRWHDRLDIIVAMTIAIGAMVGWLHSDWELGSRIESIEKSRAVFEPMELSDHEAIVEIKSFLKNRKSNGSMD